MALSIGQITGKLNRKIEDSLTDLKTLDSAWNGDSPMAFLSPESRKALGNRLPKLGVNIPRLGLMSLVERMSLRGVRRDGELNLELWGHLQRAGIMELVPQAILDALIYGRAFLTVWGVAPGKPAITVDSPMNMAVLRDPVTREVTHSLKRWREDERAYAVLSTRTRIYRLTHPQKVIDAEVFPADGWTVVKSEPNPLGVVPVIPLVNRARLSTPDGLSEMADVLPLSDALNKIMADAMVTSEKYARPRRWATGLEIMEDDDGNPVNPFSDTSQLWQAEGEQVKFGQFDPARLDGYTALIDSLTKQIGALLSLPPHYLGLNGDQPPSADSIRSAEASLVSRVIQIQRAFTVSLVLLVKLFVAIREGIDVEEVDVDLLWVSPETRTPMQAADAALKIKQIDPRLLPYVLEDVLGLLPEDAKKVLAAVTPVEPVPADPAPETPKESAPAPKSPAAKPTTAPAGAEKKETDR